MSTTHPDHDTILSLLCEIRDSIRAANTRLDANISRVDATNSRLDETINRLDAANNRFDMSVDDPFGVRAVSDETWAILRQLGF